MLIIVKNKYLPLIKIFTVNKQIFPAFLSNEVNISWILYYRGWIILILNSKRHGIFVLSYATNTKQDLETKS